MSSNSQDAQANRDASIVVRRPTASTLAAKFLSKEITKLAIQARKMKATRVMPRELQAQAGCGLAPIQAKSMTFAHLLSPSWLRVNSLLEQYSTVIYLDGSIEMFMVPYQFMRYFSSKLSNYWSFVFFKWKNFPLLNQCQIIGNQRQNTSRDGLQYWFVPFSKCATKHTQFVHYFLRASPADPVKLVFYIQFYRSCKS